MSKSYPAEFHKLHQMLAEEFARMLTDPGEDGVTHQELNVIRQFLKDNDVNTLALLGDSAFMAEGTPLRTVFDNLPDQLPDEHLA